MEAAKVKIAWTRKASRHLRDAYNFWADERSLRDARIMLDRIFAAVEVLEKFPEAGRRGRIPGMRELVVVPTPFVIAHRVRRGKIEVLTLLHSSRKWPENF